MKILPNGIAVVEGDLWLSKWVEETGELCHDKTVTEHILPHIPVGGVVIDGGAAIGDHTDAYATKVGPTGMVLAFEVNPVALECLRHNMEKHRNVVVHARGLSNAPGLGTVIQDPTHNLGAAQVVAHSGLAENAVVLTTIDSLMSLPSMTRCDFIKLDLEGYELNALQGAIWTLKTYRPKLVLEMNTGCLNRMGVSAKDVFRFLEAVDYLWQFLTPNNCAEQYDILCTSKH